MNSNLSLLLVDNEEDEHNKMQIALSMIDKSCELISAKNFDEVRKHLSTELPSVIFLDINIPGYMAGFLEQVKNRFCNLTLTKKVNEEIKIHRRTDYCHS